MNWCGDSWLIHNWGTIVALGAELHQADHYARESLERLKRYNLAPTPNNFALFYHYSSGQYPNLTMAISQLLKDHTELNQQQCDELYHLHLGLEAEQKLLKAANNSIEAEISRVLAALDSASTDAGAYSKTLDQFSGQLAGQGSLSSIREAVQRVIDETRVMSQQNQRLQEQLQQTTNQLTEMRQKLDVVHKESQIDPLTEVGNRKFFDREIEHAVAEAVRENNPLTLLMIDIDHFKKFNDSFGHQIGDQVLKLVARTLVENLKGRDIIARYGGEEFVILLPNTKAEDAEKVGNQLRASLGSKQLKRRSTNETLGTITVSIGASQYYVGEELDSFIHRADAAMYRAKQEGRNRVVISSPSAGEMAAITGNVTAFQQPNGTAT